MILQDLRNIIQEAKQRAIRSVDFERVLMYWQIGKRILEEEQGGQQRAEYGKYLLKTLSEELEPEFGSGFSIRQLERYRQFYRIYPIASTLRTQLSWTHYKLLISINNDDKRLYYFEESSKNNWPSRQLERQINSQLYERLLLSNDKTSVLEVAKQEKLPQSPKKSSKTQWF